MQRKDEDGYPDGIRKNYYKKISDLYRRYTQLSILRYTRMRTRYSVQLHNLTTLLVEAHKFVLYNLIGTIKIKFI